MIMFDNRIAIEVFFDSIHIVSPPYLIFGLKGGPCQIFSIRIENIENKSSFFTFFICFYVYPAFIIRIECLKNRVKFR